MKIEDIMTENVITVFEDTAVAEAALILTQHSFNGLPVVDKNGKLVGLFTERDMLSDRSYIHLKTLLKLFSEVDFYKKDNSEIKEELNNIIDLKVRDVMTSVPTVIRPSDSIEQAVALFAEPKNNPLPVVNQNGMLKGIISMSDLIKLYGVRTKDILQEKQVDKKVDEFIKKFEKNFVVVSRFRVSTWFIASLLFTIVGFAIAMFFILRINI